MLKKPIQVDREGPAPLELLRELLAEQGQLTAVEKFARQHEQHEIFSSRYRDLIPISKPPEGKQFAFEVNLDKCSGCKSCVTACHSLNGLDEGEAWREVNVLVSTDWRHPFQQSVTSACHHCVDPACLHGCPVLAYEKDPVTGIVSHLDDQCIGCQYCVMKCPYEVPRYLPKRGIVRKCDMCSQRLAADEAPACVQACPNEAIRITVVSRPSNPTEWVQSLPSQEITLPTTRYISKNPLPIDLVPAHSAKIPLQPPHLPLVGMLVLTQLSVGCFLFLPFAAAKAWGALSLLGTSAGFLGLIASVFHLGKPLKAWRSFLGLRRSWLSREIVVLGLFVFLATVLAASLLIPRRIIPASVQTFLMMMAWVTGLLGVFCSGMVYHDTRRVFWLGARSIGKFFGSTIILGLAANWVIAAAMGQNTAAWGALLGLATLVKLAGESRLLRRATNERGDQRWPKAGEEAEWSLARSAVRMRDDLGLITRSRIFLGILGGVSLPWISLLEARAIFFVAPISLILSIFGELAERYLFFRAVVPPSASGNL